MKTPIVTLTTDWGSQGFFAGMVKGALMGMVEGVQVVDITHGVEPFNVRAAAFVVKHGCKGFPEGTVHIVDVASTYSEERPFVAVKACGQYYLCCDNGLPAMALGADVEDVSLIPVQENGVYNFAAYTLFTRVAAMLIGGASMRDIGPRRERLLNRPYSGWVQQGDSYRIYIDYVDNYGNAYLGMSYSEFETLRQGRRFSIAVREQEVTDVMASYLQQHAQSDPRHRLRMTVSATGMLELAVKESSFTQLMGLRATDSVLLQFR
ncbi:MAG: SAM-dependent chlorinase/fluorinase [Bacteroidales bacterium]|nr:SAM-dependent chlorinase/fluorinase [Bacteroidales bacterium]